MSLAKIKIDKKFAKVYLLFKGRLQSVIVALGNVGSSWMLAVPNANFVQLRSPKSLEIVGKAVCSDASNRTISNQMIKDANNVLFGQENAA